MRKKALSIIAVLFGLVMVNSGLNKFFNYMPIPEDLPEAVLNAMAAFMELGWLFPLVAIVEIAGGILFAIPKYRALGAIVILPVVVGIVLFHSFQAPEGVVISILILAINIWAIIENLDKYLPMIGKTRKNI